MASGFDIELAALREVGLLVVNVIHFKERAGAFASGGGEHGGIGEGVALRVHEFAGGANRFGANAEDGGLARGADPEMALVEQEIDAMLFELDGEGRGVGNFLDDVGFWLTPISKPPGARCSARIFPVTMTLDSWVRPLRASKASGFSFREQTP